MYYIGIVCPEELDKKIMVFKNWMKEHFGCVVALKSPAHITLIPPFWLGETNEPVLQESLRSFRFSGDELDIQLDGFSHFGKRVLFVNVKANPWITEVQQQVEDHFIRLLENTVKPGDRPFHPHITIANRDMRPSAFINAWEHFSKREFKESFRTRIISLLKLSPGRWEIVSSSNW